MLINLKQEAIRLTKNAVVIGFLLLFQVALVQADTKTTTILHPKGLLWKISHPGYKDSYLFGTIHLSDPRVLSLIDRVEPYIQKSELFAMEMVIDETSQQELVNASYFAENESLADYLDKDLLQQVHEIMQRYYNVVPATVNKMRPWVVMASLSTPPPEYGGAVLDVQLQHLADSEGLPVSGLETTQEQVSALSSLNIQEQVWMLRKSVIDFYNSETMWPVLITFYLHRDLEALVNTQNQLMDETSDIDDRFMYAMLQQRNHRMAERMITLMQKQSVFVAVGALHLPGEEGVLSLLEQRGFRVEVLY